MSFLRFIFVLAVVSIDLQVLSPVDSSQVLSLHFLSQVGMAFLRLIFFLDVVSLDLPVPSIIAVGCTVADRFTRLVENAMVDMHFQACLLHVTFMFYQKQEKMFFCCSGLLKEDVQPL